MTEKEKYFYEGIRTAIGLVRDLVPTAKRSGMTGEEALNLCANIMEISFTEMMIDNERTGH